MPKTKFSKSELSSISRLLHEECILPLEQVMIYPDFLDSDGNIKYWHMYLTANDKSIHVLLVTTHDLKEHKLVDQLLKYFGKPDEKDSS